MTSSLTRMRALLALILASAFFTSIGFAADPKVVRTSHETRTKAVPQETEDQAEDESGYSPQWPEPPNTGALLVRLVVGTVTVLGLCVGFLWFGKPWLQRLQVAGTANSAMQIEGSISVGNRAVLYLVRAGTTQLIAGTDATGLKSLIALPPSFKEVLDEQVPDIEQPSAPTPLPISSAIPFSIRGASRQDSKG